MASATLSSTTTVTTTTTTTITITKEEVVSHYKRFVDGEKRGLRAFYDDAALDARASIGEKMANSLLADKCGKEVAQQLSLLTLYDIVILLDDSSSMETEEKGDRKETLKKTLDAITKVYDLANEKGILSVRFLNAKQGRKNFTNSKVEDLFKDREYNGVTRIGTELDKKVLKRFLLNEKLKVEKPLLVMIITDGAVEGEREGLLEDVIVNCVTKLEEQDPKREKHTVAFHFSRVGNDEGAALLLETLDNKSRVSKYVDCLPVNSRLEKVDDPGHKWAVLPKLLVGAIVDDWNKQDDTLDYTPDGEYNPEDEDEDSDIE